MDPLPLELSQSFIIPFITILLIYDQCVMINPLCWMIDEQQNKYSSGLFVATTFQHYYLYSIFEL